MVQRVRHGSRVARGRDWKVVKHGNQDGTPPGPGTVTAVAHGDPIGKGVQVTWDRTGKVHWYSMGCRTRKCELRLLPPELKPHIGADQKLIDVSSMSFQTEMKSIWEFSVRSNLKPCVRTLLGLHCDVDPAWSLTVLQQAAPRLKALQLVSPQQQHLDAALAMPLLEGLCVCNVTGPQLQQVVRMASLRRLELHCPPDAALSDIFTFPGTAAGLRWLRSGLYPLVTALALVRAHADTLEELQLVAASTEPYGCPDLARELQRCGLKKLKKMVILRRDAHDAFCRHDQNTCREQLSQILHIFSERGLSVAVLCSECNLNSEII
ncbi:uncharacterized protein LOC117643833 [Thrips palmi]|uniref:Uncharacterized protein LOC117643833 n=1 Tax=Thrips palmi TaxID=161013 RepID=A0A6P8ZLH0_THRPL|nr:uncharacterized protein LOC117643833 [Thrips palmi]